MATPTTLQELFEFYHSQVKPLYSIVQLQNELPVEVLFELNAALDHLSRQYSYGETEQEVVRSAYAHLKRSCLDIFKLAVKDATKQFSELRQVDTSIIDNGEYDRGLIELYHRIIAGAAKARTGEGDTRKDTDAIKAFELWEPVYADCAKLTTDYYNHRQIAWANKKQKRDAWKERAIGFVTGVIGSIIATILLKWLLGW